MQIEVEQRSCCSPLRNSSEYTRVTAATRDMILVDGSAAAAGCGRSTTSRGAAWRNFSHGQRRPADVSWRWRGPCAVCRGRLFSHHYPCRNKCPIPCIHPRHRIFRTSATDRERIRLRGISIRGSGPHRRACRRTDAVLVVGGRHRLGSSRRPGLVPGWPSASSSGTRLVVRCRALLRVGG